ncbi:unnamed protein product [Vitrella brassicaformis CCMP3155]|uniref:Uncharacterized protein n=1 Tax=Vitrella brassicaformis (strain CCMP3155) TaxID=1169540 RepID=A0A0G4EIT4_VITBC|nr:unnamed protein product [Vitrella brassicaformis CCMP3155]|eukprot:CEL96925.1 unnamed protein product [Vitrella brassicaformis CCMP3155]
MENVGAIEIPGGLSEKIIEHRVSLHRQSATPSAGRDPHREVVCWSWFRHVRRVHIRQKGVTWHRNEKLDTEYIFMNNVVVGASKCVRSVERHLKHPGKFTIENNLFVDCDTVGVNVVAPGNQLFPREEYIVDYNQYKLPAAAKLVDIGQGKPDDSERYKTLAELRAAARGRWIEGWEDHGSDTVQIGEGFQANESFADWRKGDINQHTIIQYDPSWFAPTSDQIGASNPSFQPEVERLLRHFSICVPMAAGEDVLPVGPHSSGNDKCFKGIGTIGDNFQLPEGEPQDQPENGSPENGSPSEPTQDELDSKAAPMHSMTSAAALAAVLMVLAVLLS